MLKQTKSLFLTAILLLALVSGDVLAANPHTRDGWMVGVSYGYSRGEIEWGGLDSGDYKGGATPQIRFGHMLGSHLALGIEYHGWMLEGGEVPLKLRSSLQSAMLAVTWYPGRPDQTLGGFYLRAGAGYGWAGLTFVEIEADPDPEEHVPLDQEHGDRTDESGIGYTLGLGYEFRISHNFAAGLGWSLDYLSVDKDIYKNGTYYPITLVMGWYWD
jgi:hypothetical protein